MIQVSLAWPLCWWTCVTIFDILGSSLWLLWPKWSNRKVDSQSRVCHRWNRTLVAITSSFSWIGIRKNQHYYWLGAGNVMSITPSSQMNLHLWLGGFTTLILWCALWDWQGEKVDDRKRESVEKMHSACVVGLLVMTSFFLSVFSLLF